MIGKDFHKENVRGEKEHWYVFEKHDTQEKGEDLYLCCIFWQRFLKKGKRIVYFSESEIKQTFDALEDKRVKERQETIEQMAQFVGKGLTPKPIEKIEIKPYDFTVEDEID